MRRSVRCAFRCCACENDPPDLQESQQSVGREALPTARGALSQPLTHHQRQIECAKVDQHALENILPSSQVHAPHPSGLIGVREAAFQQLPPPPQQLFPPLPANPPPVAIHRLLRFRFVFPTTPSAIRFRDIGSNLHFRQRL